MKHIAQVLDFANKHGFSLPQTLNAEDMQLQSKAERDAPKGFMLRLRDIMSFSASGQMFRYKD